MAAKKKSDQEGTSDKDETEQPLSKVAFDAIQLTAWNIYQRRLLEGRGGDDMTDWKEALEALEKQYRNQEPDPDPKD